MHTLSETVEILERTPNVVRALFEGLSEPWLISNYGPRTWCAQEVLGHLIIGEKADWIPRLRRILTDGPSTPFDPFPHDATIPLSEGRSLPSLLDEFAMLRTQSLAALASFNLQPSDLDRPGTHPALGRVTLGQLLATWAVHDLHHIRQMTLALAWRYRDEVGPWRAYLNTLNRSKQTADPRNAT